LAKYRKAASLEALLDITRALADGNRLRALNACREGEVCACQIIALLGLAPSTVSRHLAILKQAGLVRSRKSGRWMHFRLAGEDAPAVVRDALDWVFRTTARDPQIREDRKHLKKILKTDPEKLCQTMRSDSGCSSSARATRAGARSQRGGPATSRGM